MPTEPLIIAGREFQSRLLVGTGKFSSNETMAAALEADASLHPQWLPQTVPGRFASIEEIAAGTLYLLSDEAGYCHGTDLLIDGGYSLR